MTATTRAQVACVVIATEARVPLLFERVFPSVYQQDFDEIVVVGDWGAHGEAAPPRSRLLSVPPLTRSTIDALVKRDAGTLATRADTIVYLCDDHALAPNFLSELREVLAEGWDVLVPNRVTEHNGVCVPLNMGEREGYCGGHAGVFKRHVITRRPWSTMPHDRLWDVHASRLQQADGARFYFRPRTAIAIIDLIPEAQPWR